MKHFSNFDCIDEVLITISPILVGGVKGIAQLLPSYSSGNPSQQNKYKLQDVQFHILGTDIVVQGKLSLL